ncbi:MAG: T9SS type A sorting domain-containing protein [Sphingobacteriales bacterium]|nr:T9SS type A sorting domain-containing protein [Sphingobacteriales bacterium]MBI3716979.1 T9SS type A sorting domain-containing protein [Sphingobacteriales bacterium]
MLHMYQNQTGKINYLKNLSFIFVLFILTAGFSLRVTAATFVVNSNGDTHAVNLSTGQDAGGNITLRSAIEAATATAGSHTITFSGAVASPINLTLGQIIVGNAANGNNITISGPGMNLLTVNQTTDNRVFSTGTGAVTFTLQDITLNCTAPGAVPYSGGGGAIIAGGAGAATTLTNVTISNFKSQIGNGGALSQSSSLTSHNLTLTNCTFLNNKCGGGGGGVSYNSQGGTATITGCIFSGNQTGPVGLNTGGDGGALSTTGGGSGGTYLVEKNTFLNNQVLNTTGHGGAVINTNGTLTLRYNRFIGNTCANVSAPPLANIIAQTGGATVNTTIADNNWWSVNTGPGTNDATALAAGGTMTVTKWLQLKTTASPNPICNTVAGLGNTTTVTTSFLSNSASEAISVSNLSTLIGLPVTWGPTTLGSLSAQQGTIQASGNATATFTSNGTGGNATVNTEVDNVPNNDATARATITVNTIPTTSAPANKIACRDGSVSFTSTITGTPAPTIVWRIGTTALVNGLQASGSTVSGQGTNTLTITNVQLADAVANYNVQATNTCGVATSSNASLTVYIPSVAPTSISGITAFCNPGSTTLTAEGGTLGTGANYQWGTGAVVGTSPLVGETNATITVSPTSTTTYWVRIENTTSPCTVNTSGVTQQVTVNQPSVAPTGATGTATVCSGGSTTLTVTGGTKGTGAVTEWFSGSCGGTLEFTGDAFTTPALTANTTYYVRYSGTCNTTTCATVTVTVNDPSVAPTSITGTTTICNGDNTTLTAGGGTLGTGANYQWGTGVVVGTSPLVGETNATITVSPTSTTTYWVRIENTTSPCTVNTSGVTQQVTVNQPSVAPTGATGTTTICSGGSTTLTVSGGTKGTGAVTEWFSGSCGGTLEFTGDAFTTPALTQNTTYYVRYSGTCNTTTCATVTVTVNDVTGGTVGTDQPICSGGDPAAFIETEPSTGSGSLTYQWQSSITNCTSNFSNIPAATGASYDPPAGLTQTTYYRRVTISTLNSEICTANSNCVTVTVNPTPNAVATPSSQTQCSGVPITTIVLSGALQGTTYNWTRDNTVAATGIAASGSGDISGTLTNTTNAPVTVTFTITPTVNDFNGCSGTPITATVLVNPIPDAVATPQSQTVSSCVALTPIVLSGSVNGTVFNWTRDNTVAATGIAASGSGNISGLFTNNTASPVTVTFTITPTANGCTGAPITATVTVNPQTTFVCPSNIVVPATIGLCNAVVNYTTPVAPTNCPQVFSYTGSIVNWTVPAGVTSITINAKGAEGGNSGGAALAGLGANMTGTFSVTPGQVLKILVGQHPTGWNNGGGGTFVTDASNNPLIVAGGGGGSSVGFDNASKHGQTGTSGGAGGNSSCNSPGGSGGNGGGSGGCGSNYVGGGGGLLTDGQNGNYAGSGGKAFVNGGAGGAYLGFPQAGFGGGGFGSGGAAGGGGGGYSGGGSAWFFGAENAVGGGGGSYNGGTAQTNIGGANSGNGSVTIIYSTGVYTVVQTAGLASGSAFPVGTTTNTFEVRDGNTVISTCSFTVKVNDMEPPTAPSAPANVTVQCNADIPSAPTLTANDNCSGQLTGVLKETTNGGSGCGSNALIITRTWTFTDQSGNTSSCSATVTVQDLTPPVLSAAPANVTVKCAGDVPAAAVLTATDNCSSVPTVTSSDVKTPGSCINNFTVTRTWTATDACGNTSTKSQLITVNDDVAPVLSAAPANVTVKCAGDVPVAAVLTATDNCGGVPTVTSADVKTPGSCINNFTVTRTWTATDACGNTSSKSQLITVNDVTPPVLSAAPANVTVKCASDVPAAAVLTATDNCGGVPSVTSSDVKTPGSCINKFTVTRTWTATDACGNTSTKSQLITVNDDVAPVLSAAPANVTVKCAGDVPAAAVLTATDNCGGVPSVTSSDVKTPGCCINKFTVTRTWTATDACGNTSSKSQLITVNDDVAPTITGATATPSCLWPPNHKMQNVYVGYTATDNCAGAVTSSLSVTSNEPVLGTGDGDTSPDWILGTDGHSLQLRAERSGNGTGRIYTITITATDACGNSSTKTVTVVVSHDISSPVSGASYKIGSTVNFAGTFWDKPGNTHTASWLIDGTSVAGTVTAEPSGLKNGTATGSYKFGAAGVYKLQMNIKDQTSAVSYVNTRGDLEAIVVIYDPNGGYAYGGGYFNSPTGALKSNASATGKVSYGFNSNYFKGATNPKGETQMQFQIGNLEFNALNFDYLAISGAKAQYKGSGKITGDQAGYNFIMTVIDGQLAGGGGVDKIRLKIFTKSGTVIYDNQPGASDAADPTTAVGSGSTVVVVNTTAAPIANRQPVNSTVIETAQSLEVSVMPNPSETDFQLIVHSNDKLSPLNIRVMNINGQLVKVMKGTLSQTYRFGHELRKGVYMVEVMQGKQRQVLKLIKF